MIKAALCQVNPTVGDISGNVAIVLRGIQKARESGCDLVVFPELVITGYPPEDLLFYPQFIQDNLKALRTIQDNTKDIAVVLGFVDMDTKTRRLYNSAAFLFNKKVLAVHRKIELPNYGVFDEKRYFAKGDKATFVRFKGMEIGLTVCEDIWIESGHVYQKNYLRRASLIINISASPYEVGKIANRTALISKLAKKSRATIIYNNLVGGQDELVFDGSSLIGVPSIGKVFCAKSFSEDTLFVDIHKKTGKGRPTSRLTRDLKLASDIEDIYQALLISLKDYTRKNGFKKVLVGMSGGVDSALVAKIAVDALGVENVLGVTMPSKFTSSETYADARLQCSRLGIKCLEFEIKDIVKKYEDTLKPLFKDTASGVAEENLQARIRGNILMAISNKFGYLVVTTGNKSEMAAGYCTLYGDMAGGYALIKDLPKTLVYKLCDYLNQLGAGEVLLKSILKRPPTAELRPNQKDQDTLPPYEVLDDFIRQYVEESVSPSAIKLRKGSSSADIQKWVRMVDINEYKRRQAPPGPKITSRVFGKDRRMPITNLYR